jgi:hypothetical protein
MAGDTPRPRRCLPRAVDGWWEEAGVAGEADGRLKYRLAALNVAASARTDLPRRWTRNALANSGTAEQGSLRCAGLPATFSIRR